MLRFYIRSYLVPGVIILLLWLKFGPCLFNALDETGIVTRKGKIVFASNRDGNWELYKMNPNGSGLRRLTRTDNIDELSPVWSPKGRHIAFVSETGENSDIEIIAPNGRNRCKLTRSPAKDVDPCWSPDGEQIAFSSNCDGNFEIYVMSSGGSVVRRLTNHTAEDRCPKWEPDGRRILFMRKMRLRKSTSYVKRVFAVSLGGGNPTDVTNTMPELGNIPSWSKKGNLVAFSGSINVSQKHGVIYVLRSSNKFLKQLTYCGDGEFDNHPTWSPDGKSIAFSRRVLYHRRPTDIYVVDLVMGDVRNLTKGVGDNDFPDWH
jgi:TolB protein